MKEYKVEVHRQEDPSTIREAWRNKVGYLHREDGPAIIWKNGATDYYLDGIKYTENVFHALVAYRKSYIVSVKVVVKGGCVEEVFVEDGNGKPMKHTLEIDDRDGDCH